MALCELMRAEDARLDAKTLAAELSALLGDSPVLVGAVDRGHKWVWTNEGFHAHLGYTQAELERMLWLDLLDADDRATVEARLKEMRGPVGPHGLQGLKTKAGDVRRVLWVATRWLRDGVALALGVPYDAIVTDTRKNGGAAAP